MVVREGETGDVEIRGRGQGGAKVVIATVMIAGVGGGNNSGGDLEAPGTDGFPRKTAMLG